MKPLCCYCGRSAFECWVMPCLELQTILSRDTASGIRLWALRSGVKLVRRKVAS